MKKVLILISLVLSFAGCANKPNNFVPDLRAKKIDLQEYASVQTRESTYETDKNISVAVAVSGGGHRSANFAASVLCQLEQLEFGKSNLLNEVDYFSTVSGGGFAIGAYYASMIDYKSKHDSLKGYSFCKAFYEVNQCQDGKTRTIRRNLERGYHERLLKGIWSIKSIGSLDRGDFLEEKFDKELLMSSCRDSNKSLTLRDVFVEKESGLTPIYPYWVTNSTIFENGAIFPHSPDVYSKYEIIGFTHNLQNLEAADVYDIPLAIGVKASASFPLAVPNSTLARSDGRSYIHLTDGGQSDNLGVTTALSLLEQEKESNEKYLIVIDAYNGTNQPYSQRESSSFIWQAAYRAAEISLDSNRLKSLDNLDRLQAEDEINISYISFDKVPNDLRNEIRNVKTKLNLTVEEQKKLFEAGCEAAKTENQRSNFKYPETESKDCYLLANYPIQIK